MEEVLELMAEAKFYTHQQVARVPRQCRKAAAYSSQQINELVMLVKAAMRKIVAVKPKAASERGIAGLRKRRQTMQKSQAAQPAQSAPEDVSADEKVPTATTQAPEEKAAPESVGTPAEPSAAAPPQMPQNMEQLMALVQGLQALQEQAQKAQQAQQVQQVQPSEPEQKEEISIVQPPPAPKSTPLQSSAQVPKAPPADPALIRGIPEASPLLLPETAPQLNHYSPAKGVPVAPPPPASPSSSSASSAPAAPPAGAPPPAPMASDESLASLIASTRAKRTTLSPVMENKKSMGAGKPKPSMSLAEELKKRPPLKVYTRRIPKELSIAQSIALAAQIPLRKTDIPRSPGRTPLKQTARANPLMAELAKKFKHARGLSTSSNSSLAADRITRKRMSLGHLRKPSRVDVLPHEWCEKEN